MVDNLSHSHHHNDSSILHAISAVAAVLATLPPQAPAVFEHRRLRPAPSASSATAGISLENAANKRKIERQKCGKGAKSHTGACWFRAPMWPPAASTKFPARNVYQYDTPSTMFCMTILAANSSLFSLLLRSQQGKLRSQKRSSLADLWIDINKTSNRRTRLLLPPLTRLPPRVVNNYTFNGDGHAGDIPLPGKKQRRRTRPDKAKKKEEERKGTETSSN
ncbi:hypothetical protein Aspvir_007569 [Aspergillus viridinutans]|uniref:Uncharacterized protein n=1 Tax=Aspergillus viridinutans TaxID=75553 RepID=A0A9P3C0W1_ASPVI|nr:uncharacterized protein Aspvir_007569 [Aspergillus viridinutans]GIK03497.1 hypothetical protein Aspvir_007569 [Aspergillus viridinutans]